MIKIFCDQLANNENSSQTVDDFDGSTDNKIPNTRVMRLDQQKVDKTVEVTHESTKARIKMQLIQVLARLDRLRALLANQSNLASISSNENDGRNGIQIGHK